LGFDIATALVSSIAIAALSTAGDFVWATWIPRHMTVYGLTHGTLLFSAIGLVLGTLASRPGRGALGGGIIGAAAAGSYYAASPIVGYAAMFLVWFAAWVGLALLYARLSDVRGSTGVVLARGVLAAAASGLAFYAISGIWRPFDPAGWDYAVHFAAWTAAYFPGFAALMAHRRLEP
jgi:hypothetical protein